MSRLGDDEYASIIRALGSQSQLEGLSISFCTNLGPNSCAALGTLLASGACNLKLKFLQFDSFHDIGDDGVAAFANGLRSIGSSLKKLLSAME
jgi:hypothetical protein